jgi:hypothetical protein
LGYEPTQLANSSVGFQTDPGAKSCTLSTVIENGHWLGDLTKPVRVIDTPGHADTEGRDESLQSKNIDCVKRENIIDAFIWVRSAESPRFKPEDRAFFKIFCEMFGTRFLDNMVIVFTKWGFSDKEERKRIKAGSSVNGVKEALWLSMVGPDFPGPPIPMIFIDALYDREDPKEILEFNKSVADLWNAVDIFSAMPVKDVKFVRSEISRLKKKIAKLQAQLKGNDEKQKELTNQINSAYEKLVALKNELIEQKKSRWSTLFGIASATMLLLAWLKR